MEDIMSSTGKRPLRKTDASAVVRAEEPAKQGNILADLRRSPLAGADLDLSRPHEEGREVEL